MRLRLQSCILGNMCINKSNSSSEICSPKYVVMGTKYVVLGTKYVVMGTKYVVMGTKYVVMGTKKLHHES